MRRMMQIGKDVALVLCAFFVLGVLQGRDEADLQAEYRRFVRKNCLPRYPIDKAIARLDGQRRLSCVIVQNGDYSQAPMVVSSVTFEAKQ